MFGDDVVGDDVVGDDVSFGFFNGRCVHEERRGKGEIKVQKGDHAVVNAYNTVRVTQHRCPSLTFAEWGPRANQEGVVGQIIE